MKRLSRIFALFSSAIVSAMAAATGANAGPPDPTATSNAAAANAPIATPAAALPNGAKLAPSRIGPGERQAPGPIDVTCDGVHVGTFASLEMFGAAGSAAIASSDAVAHKVESSSLKYARVSLKYGAIDTKAVDGFIKVPKGAERTCDVTKKADGKLERYTMVGTWTRVDAKGSTGMEGGEKPAPSFDVRVTSFKHQ